MPGLPLSTRLTVASLTPTYFATSASLRVTHATVIARCRSRLSCSPEWHRALRPGPDPGRCRRCWTGLPGPGWADRAGPGAGQGARGRSRSLLPRSLPRVNRWGPVVGQPYATRPHSRVAAATCTIGTAASRPSLSSRPSCPYRRRRPHQGRRPYQRSARPGNGARPATPRGQRRRHPGAALADHRGVRASSPLASSTALVRRQRYGTVDRFTTQVKPAAADAMGAAGEGEHAVGARSSQRIGPSPRPGSARPDPQRGPVELEHRVRVALLGLGGEVAPAGRLRQPRRGGRAGRAEAERRRLARPRQRHPAAVPARVRAAGAGEHRVLRAARPGCPRPRRGRAPRPGTRRPSRAAPGSAGSRPGPGGCRARRRSELPCWRRRWSGSWVKAVSTRPYRVTCRVTSWLDSTQVAGALDRRVRGEGARRWSRGTRPRPTAQARKSKLNAVCSSSGRR